ncbi:SusC/RagA family TonB-linked outer membrane protein, partial [Bacteroides pyogenes]|nr:SusC/RagA family TonB-linked outer membrane protein [Bacteroides pyogenes]
FTLPNVPSSAKTLQVSYIGMQTQEVAIRPSVRIVLKSDAKELEEVVVTAMGVTREKKALGYAATSIKGDEIAQSKAVNPMNALQGKVAGIDISTAPGPGATQNVIIRGASSFGNNQPLYIVDGVPITNAQNRSGDNLNSQVDFGSGINALNPDDIADMTILKGAAATALYGSRAANGVIMITTKSGKDTEGKIQIIYDGGYTMSRVGRLPEEQSQFGQGWSGDRALDENGNWGAPYDGKDRVWGRIVDNEQQVKPYVFLKNRVRDFYTLGHNFKNSLSLSGGTAKTNYFVSLSQNSLDGVIPTSQDSYNRYTIATRGSHQAGKIKASTSVNFSTEKTRAVPSGQGTSLHRSLYEIASDISIVDLKDYHSKFNNLDNYFTPYGLNPYYVLNEDGAVQNKKKIFGKFQLDYELIEGLNLTYRFGGDFEVSTSESHIAPVKFTSGAPNDGSSTANAGSYEEVRRERTQLNHDFMVGYKKNLTTDLSLNVIAGVNANERKYNWLRGAITSIDIPGFYNLSNSRSPSVSSQRKERRRLVGVYMNADFGYKDYAYLTLTARNDWSSTLPKSNNSYFYPGATFSLLITELLKSKDIDTGFLNFAKFRMAYGMTGNDAGMYYIYDRYVPGNVINPGYPNVDDLSFPLNGINSYTVSNQLGNPDLKPELTREFEIGLEARFFDNRIGFDISYYNRYTDGLIDIIPKDPSSGYTSQIKNLGDVRNKGVELTINVTPVKIKDFSWNIAWNFSANRNKVEKLDVDEVFLGGFGGAGIYAVKGKPLGQFKLTGIKKVEIEGKEYTIVDGKGNPQPTAQTEYFGKDINEKYRMGFTNTFTWKGLSVFATFDYRHGGHIYSNTKKYMHWTGSAPETVLNDRKPFLVPNSVIDNGDGTYRENTTPVDPTALHTFYSDRGGLKGNQSAVISRSYLKLRDAGIAYQVPKSLCSKLHINNIRLSFNASNILIWTPRENPYIDPETTTFGNDVSAKFGEFNANPSNQLYTFGLTLAF